MAFDAIIVGAGIIGASIAWRLSQSGLRVLLLDAARMGSARRSRSSAGLAEWLSGWLMVTPATEF